MKVGPSAAKTSWMALKSLFPTHTPVTIAPSVTSGSGSGARKPTAWRSRKSFVVPVFSVAGRRVPSSVWSWKRGPHSGLVAGSVLSARMSVTR